MTIVEYGEMAYAEVSSHDFDVDVILGEMDFDELIECIKEDGCYVTVSYGVQVCTPDRDEYMDFEEEVFVEVEQAVDRLADLFNQVSQQKANAWTKLREAQDRINELERPTRYDISDVTRGMMGISE